MAGSYPYSWEQAVRWLLDQPDRQDLVRDCFFDDPINLAADRFHACEEWAALRAILSKQFPSRVLDIGAGRGISSYAFAKEGCEIIAVEPDLSPLVGINAIKNLVNKTGIRIKVVQGYGESLPFKDNTFDIVYGRAVLHHTHNLEKLCCDAARVLKPGAVFIATREHVISRPQDLDQFLTSHPLHALYGGENALLLKEYTSAIIKSGLKLLKVFGPYESVINYAPMSQEQFRNNVISLLKRFAGNKISNYLVDNTSVFALLSSYLSRRSNIPGRLYSFIAVKR